jgi:hypothetical protein
VSASESYSKIRFSLCCICQQVETPANGPCSDCLAEIHSENA